MPVLLRAAAVTLVLAALGYQAPPAPSAAGRYEDLTALFTEWRAFQRPRKADGVPDYTPAAMQAQGRALPAWQQRLAAIDSSAWPIPQQADWHIVRAEMNGLDFDHRVLRPWANTPAFYVTVFGEESDQPARESHYADAAVELWSYTWPLSDAAIAEIDRGLRVPGSSPRSRPCRWRGSSCYAVRRNRAPDFRHGLIFCSAFQSAASAISVS